MGERESGAGGEKKDTAPLTLSIHPQPFHSPRALLSLTPADPATPRTVTPLVVEGGEAASVGPSAFPAVETGGAAAAAVSFGDPTAPSLTLLLVVAPLTSPAAAAGVAAGLAGLLPSDRPLDVTVVAALPGVTGPGAAVVAAAVLPATSRVPDPAVAALLPALAGVGVRPALLAVRGHRPVVGGSGGDEDAAAAAAALGEAVAGKVGGVARWAPERAARLAADGRAVRAGGRGDGGAGMTREPEGGGLMYS